MAPKAKGKGKAKNGKNKGRPDWFPPPAAAGVVAGDPHNASGVRVAYLVRGDVDRAFTPWPFMVQRVSTAGVTATGALYMAQVTAQDISRGGVLSSTAPQHRFNVLFVPGGLASVHAKALGAEGKRAVTDFIGRGGGFFGICAGAYLGCVHRDLPGQQQSQQQHGKGKGKNAGDAKSKPSRAAGDDDDADADGDDDDGDEEDDDDGDDDGDDDADGDGGSKADAKQRRADEMKYGAKVTVMPDGSATVNTRWAYALVRVFLRDVLHWNRGVGDHCHVSYSPLGVRVLCHGLAPDVVAAYPTKLAVAAASHDPKLSKAARKKMAANAAAAATAAAGSGAGAGAAAQATHGAAEPAAVSVAVAVAVAVADDGGAACGDDAPVMTMRYANGPLFDLCKQHEARATLTGAAAAGAAGAGAGGGGKWDWKAAAAAVTGDGVGATGASYACGPVEVWARFETEFTRNKVTPKGVMVGSPAVVASRFGRGRVVLCSPHPEKSHLMMAEHLKNVFRWCAGTLFPDANANVPAADGNDAADTEPQYAEAGVATAASGAAAAQAKLAPAQTNAGAAVAAAGAGAGASAGAAGAAGRPKQRGKAAS